MWANQMFLLGYNLLTIVNVEVNMNEIVKDLGNDLILRRSRVEDTESLAAFNKKIHAEDEWAGRGLETWTRDLMSGNHPTFGLDDFTIVENTNDHTIVSAMNLISQTWAYEGIPFGVGRPELVGTLPEYRGRGLVREQFNVVHQWSLERGELVQGITGIPWYYRQFGYEMALNLHGGRAGYISGVEELKDGEQELYTLREAEESDLAFIAALYEANIKRDEISAVWSEDLWRFEILGKDKFDIAGSLYYIVEDEAHAPQGYIAVPSIKWGNMTSIVAYELIAEVSWFKITPSVVRWLWKFGEEQAIEQNKKQQAYGFWLGEEHPVYKAYAEHLPRVRRPYAWYIRVPDLAKFIQTIAPALEARLEKSILHGYSGEKSISFYRSGLKIKFESGRLIDVENVERKDLIECQAEFPDLTFLQLLFGRRSLEELCLANADLSYRGDEVKVLLEALFPRKASNVWAIA
ncbi:MAG: GNAT family N-acetyltransferase [Anaerolineaceae bacterium]|nr:GNAT family N-acetyltransferase [Anaerolineaceae bacterium]